MTNEETEFDDLLDTLKVLSDFWENRVPELSIIFSTIRASIHAGNIDELKDHTLIFTRQQYAKLIERREPCKTIQ